MPVEGPRERVGVPAPVERWSRWRGGLAARCPRCLRRWGHPRQAMGRTYCLTFYDSRGLIKNLDFLRTRGDLVSVIR